MLPREMEHLRADSLSGKLSEKEEGKAIRQFERWRDCCIETLALIYEQRMLRQIPYDPQM